jgi:hypothetical protein
MNTSLKKLDELKIINKNIDTINFNLDLRNDLRNDLINEIFETLNNTNEENTNNNENNLLINQLINENNNEINENNLLINQVINENNPLINQVINENNPLINQVINENNPLINQVINENHNENNPLINQVINENHNENNPLINQVINENNNEINENNLIEKKLIYINKNEELNDLKKEIYNNKLEIDKIKKELDKIKNEIFENLNKFKKKSYLIMNEKIDFNNDKVDLIEEEKKFDRFEIIKDNFDKNNELNNNVEIIIARFNEDLSWLDELPFNQFKYIVYNKGDNQNFCKTNVKKIVNLPNVGKCDHTYLYHIINNYNNLSKILVFLPGSINMENKKNKAITILNYILNSKYINAYFIGNYHNSLKLYLKDFQLEDWSSSSNLNFYKNSESQLLKCKFRPYWKWYNFFFGKAPSHWITYNGIFSIDKRDIIQHPISRYQNIIKSVDFHSNPEAGHYIERSWGAIFFPLIHTIKIHE